MMTYIEVPLILWFAVCGYLGYTVAKMFELSGKIVEMKEEVKNYGKDYESR